MKKKLIYLTGFIMAVGALSLPAHAVEKHTKKSTMKHSYKVPVEEEAPKTDMKNHAMAGCGLGSLAISDRGKWSQVGASLLNGTGLQSIAITVGTSNCAEDGVVEASHEKEAFVEANYADLSHDLVIGQGEYLNAFASLYGCAGAKKTDFAKTLKNNQQNLIPEQSPMLFLQKVDALMKKANTCQA